MNHQILPPLLEMERQSATDQDMLAIEAVGCRVLIKVEEATRVVKCYEYRRDSSCTCSNLQFQSGGMSNLRP
jgi:hypothetical protein